VKISKTEYAVQYQVEQTYLKIRAIGQLEEMSCLISNGMRQIFFLQCKTHYLTSMKNADYKINFF
jgi:hypothetical protein